MGVGRWREKGDGGRRLMEGEGRNGRGCKAFVIKILFNCGNE